MDWLDHLHAHTEGLAAIAEQTEPATEVPTCPGWSMSDLTWHLLDVQTFWEHIITNRPTGPETYVEPPRPADLDLPDGLRTACDALIAALEIADPTDAAWSWSSDPADHTVGFTPRRQAHEAFVHRADAIAAAEVDLPAVAPEFGADGLDEIIRLNLTGAPEWASLQLGDERITLRCTDADFHRTLRFGRWSGTSPSTGTTYLDEPAVEVDGGEATTEIAGPAVELDLWLWGRRPDEVVTVTGPRQLARRLWELAREATQ